MQMTKINELLFFSFLNALQEKQKSLELVTGIETQTQRRKNKFFEINKGPSVTSSKVWCLTKFE